MKSHNMCFFDIRMDKNVNCDENNKKSMQVVKKCKITNKKCKEISADLCKNLIDLKGFSILNPTSSGVKKIN